MSRSARRSRRSGRHDYSDQARASGRYFTAGEADFVEIAEGRVDRQGGDRGRHRERRHVSFVERAPKGLARGSVTARVLLNTHVVIRWLADPDEVLSELEASPVFRILPLTIEVAKEDSIVRIHSL
jgi:hypothetical protein